MTFGRARAAAPPARSTRGSATAPRSAGPRAGRRRSTSRSAHRGRAFRAQRAGRARRGRGAGRRPRAWRSTASPPGRRPRGGAGARRSCSGPTVDDASRCSTTPSTPTRPRWPRASPRLAAQAPEDGAGRVRRGRRVAILGDMLELGPQRGRAARRRSPTTPAWRRSRRSTASARGCARCTRRCPTAQRGGWAETPEALVAGLRPAARRGRRGAGQGLQGQPGRPASLTRSGELGQGAAPGATAPEADRGTRCSTG